MSIYPSCLHYNYNMNIIVRRFGKKINIQRAIELGYITIEEKSIIPNVTSVICQSTNLFDMNGKEIYVGDILIDAISKNEYEVIQYYASIFIKRLDNKNACIIDTITNYKLGNTIDFYIKNQNEI